MCELKKMLRARREIAEVLSSIAGAAGDSLVTRPLESSHSRQFLICTLKSSIKGQSDSRRIATTNMALWRMGSARRLVGVQKRVRVRNPGNSKELLLNCF